MYSKLHVVVGDKELDIELKGLDKLNQIHTMKGLLISFFNELLREVSLEEQKELEEKELRLVASKLGIEEDQFLDMANEFAKIQPKKADRLNVTSIVQNKTENHTTINTRPDLEEDKEKEIEPDYTDSWKRLTSTGKTLYQSFYICTQCHNKGKRFVEKGSSFLQCHECGEKMNLKAAAPGNFPHIDQFNNVYIAGKFIRADQYEPIKTMAEKEEEEKELESKKIQYLS